MATFPLMIIMMAMITVIATIAAVEAKGLTPEGGGRHGVHTAMLLRSSALVLAVPALRKCS